MNVLTSRSNSRPVVRSGSMSTAEIKARTRRCTPTEAPSFPKAPEQSPEYRLGPSWARQRGRPSLARGRAVRDAPRDRATLEVLCW